MIERGRIKQNNKQQNENRCERDEWGGMKMQAL